MYLLSTQSGRQHVDRFFVRFLIEIDGPNPRKIRRVCDILPLKTFALSVDSNRDDGGEPLWLFRPDSSSLPLLPRLAHDERDVGFTFANPEETSALLGTRPGSEREELTVIVGIDDYLSNDQEKEVYHSARLPNVFFPLSDGQDVANSASRADPPAGCR